MAATPPTTTVHCYNWNTIPSANPRPGVVQRGFRGEKTMVSMAELHPTMSGNPHSHDIEQIFMILKGRVKLHIGDQVVEMAEGSIVRIPPNVVHWSEPPSAGDGAAVNMDIFSIIRDDHLKLVTYQADDFSAKG
jgi:quercetin dioxygenase-like cupin family protein